MITIEVNSILALRVCVCVWGGLWSVYFSFRIKLEGLTRLVAVSNAMGGGGGGG